MTNTTTRKGRGKSAKSLRLIETSIRTLSEIQPCNMKSILGNWKRSISQPDSKYSEGGAA